uniref:Glycerophosphocholine acyltransferase 1 n=1 Tax=Heterorhabditis bacteriophora TaxID=37862 RepID=A0A1I7X231_HETBA
MIMEVSRNRITSMILRLLLIAQIYWILFIAVDCNPPFTRTNYKKEPGYPVVLGTLLIFGLYVLFISLPYWFTTYLLLISCYKLCTFLINTPLYMLYQLFLYDRYITLTDFLFLLVPGDGGSQLEANLTGKPSVVHYVCSKYTSDYFDLWLNLELFAPLVIDCWVDNMMLVYNATTGNSTNMPGVDIRVPGFGGTSSIVKLFASGYNMNYYRVVLPPSKLRAMQR